MKYYGVCTFKTIALRHACHGACADTGSDDARFIDFIRHRRQLLIIVSGSVLKPVLHCVSGVRRQIAYSNGLVSR